MVEARYMCRGFELEGDEDAVASNDPNARFLKVSL
jgi:hypothetical protein